jgi:hypothetical protein
MKSTFLTATLGALLMCAGVTGCVRNRPYRLGQADSASQLPPTKQLPSEVDPLRDKECGSHKPYECVQVAKASQAQHFYLAHIEYR